MNWLHMILTFVQLFAAFAIIGLVLLQRGKGADAGAGFGAGASARCSARAARRTALSRATAIFAAVFMLNSLALAYLGSHRPPCRSEAFSMRRSRRSRGAAVRDPPAAAPAQTAPPPASRRRSRRSSRRPRLVQLPTWWNW